MTETIGFLGPRGTFTEAAVTAMSSLKDAKTVPLLGVDAVLRALVTAEIHGGVVPIENSLEGPVVSTIHALVTSAEPLVIVEEIETPVRFSLMVRPGTTLADVKDVATIPIAAAQCAAWLKRYLPSAQLVPTPSTAQAVKQLAKDDSPQFDAAIGPTHAAALYNLEVLADDIGDADAFTRFVLIRKAATPPAPTGADKTTLALFIRADHSGALLEILTEFAVRGVNLTRIESRPTRKRLDDYYFSVDCEGHVADARVGEALMGLRRVCADVRYFGSYPRHDGREAHIVLGTTDADYAAATEWVRQIRNEG